MSDSGQNGAAPEKEGIDRRTATTLIAAGVVGGLAVGEGVRYVFKLLPIPSPFEEGHMVIFTTGKDAHDAVVNALRKIDRHPKMSIEAGPTVQTIYKDDTVIAYSEKELGFPPTGLSRVVPDPELAASIVRDSLIADGYADTKVHTLVDADHLPLRIVSSSALKDCVLVYRKVWYKMGEKPKERPLPDPR